MCGDAANSDDVAELMAGQKAQLVFTDPPYNVGYIGKTKSALRIKNDALRADKFRELLERAFELQFAHSVAGAPIYVCHAALQTDAFARSLETAGWHIAQCIVWAKHHFVFGRSDYHWKHEPILYGWKPGARHPWYSDRKQTTVWNFKRPMRNAEHPTMKPIDLVAHALGNSSAAGDVVLDTFAGAGSGLIAAEVTGRTAYVMELDPGYCDVIRLRYGRNRRAPEWRPTAKS
jgi:DNA modification methylase